MLILTPLICTQVLALFAGQPYDMDLQELQNLDAHLTNTCRHAGGDIGEEEAVRLLSELPEVYIWYLSCPPCGSCLGVCILPFQE